MTTTTINRYVGIAGRNEIFDVVGAPLQVNAGDGNDYINSSVLGEELLIGGPGSDVIRDDGGDEDVIFGDSTFDDDVTGVPGGAFDAIYGGPGRNTIFAGPGADYVNAEGGNDFVYGGSGNDRLFGGFGNDLIFGQNGDDFILGGTGAVLPNDALRVAYQFNGVNDAIQFGVSPDFFGGQIAVTDLGNDTLNGGNGNDLVSAQGGNDFVFGGDGFDTLDGGDGNDVIDGGEDRDIIGGGADNDVIAAGLGDDYIDGQGGDDFIRGQEGEDLVIGGGGTDTLFGGQGSDVFLFRAGDGTDLIVDFVAGVAADAVALSGFAGVTSFAQVQANLSFFAAGNATVLQLGTQQLFFIGITPGQLDGSDFFFT